MASLVVSTQYVLSVVTEKHHIFTPAGREGADEARWVGGQVSEAGMQCAVEARRTARRV